jgi:hypothetical protein
MHTTGRSLRAAAIAAVALACGAACHASVAPKNWLSKPAQTQQEAWGAWIRAQYFAQARHDTAPAQVQGELIATGPDSLHVLTATGLVSIPMKELNAATLSTYESHWGTVALWSAMGGLSTPSHGLFAILSLPLWLITGTVASSSASGGPIVQSTAPELLRPYARFPQGMPPGLDRSSLRIKAAP